MENKNNLTEEELQYLAAQMRSIVGKVGESAYKLHIAIAASPEVSYTNTIFGSQVMNEKIVCGSRDDAVSILTSFTEEVGNTVQSANTETVTQLQTLFLDYLPKLVEKDDTFGISLDLENALVNLSLTHTFVRNLKGGISSSNYSPEESYYTLESIKDSIDA